MTGPENTADMIRVTREQRRAAIEIWDARRAELAAARERVDQLTGQLKELLGRAFNERNVLGRRYFIYAADGAGRLDYVAADYRDAISQAVADGHPLIALTAMSSDADSPGEMRPCDGLLVEYKREAASDQG